VYRGDSEPQLTVRAVIVGMLLGALMCASNLYVSLKTGWSFGVTITAGVLAFALFSVLSTLGVVRREFGQLENNAMQSVASAAGYMTGGGTVAAIPALMLATHQNLPWHVMFFWITTIAMLGVVMAIPMKRQMINQENLPFPSGIAAAETLRSLHAKGGEAMQRARVLVYCMFAAGGFKWLVSAHARWWPNLHLPESVGLPFAIHGIPAKRWTLELDFSALLIAAGAIMGWRSAWSLALGAAVNYGVLAPWGHSVGAIRAVSLRGITGWTVWFGSSLLLTSGLLSFAFSWPQIKRAIGDPRKLFVTRPAGEDPVADIEVPMNWFAIGMLVLAPLVIVLARVFFGIALWMGLVAIILSFFIAIVAARATGETDVTPTGALGKITQLTFGVLARGSVTTNLMTANMSAGVAIHSADLLTDLKSGYILGAKPRQQFYAQFFGVLAGAMLVVPAFRLMVPNWTVIGTPAAQAPGALAWNSVAQVLARGVSQLPTSARYLILVGSVLGIALVLLERWFPSKKKYIPSATGFGLAFTMSASNSLAMFLGGLIALIVTRSRPVAAEKHIVPVSSGLIAGESIMGIVIALLTRLGVLHAG